ncbi:MAG: 2-isopropylmalate synthase [Armatimonadetes bacterium]|nr:2-isopropylmalate synthase [Armatimonadota bacterium]
MMLEELVYDWNQPDAALYALARDLQFQDETLRDGLQCPSVCDPPIEAKLEILHLMEALGIHGADVGLPGAGPRAVEDVTRIVGEIVEQKLKIKPSCAGRTLAVDIDPIAHIAEKTGKVLEADLFIGSSPIRQYAEGWDLDRLLHVTEEAVTYAVERGLEVMYVTEDTVRSHPEALRRLYRTAIECGARRICLCDTVGHATPRGVFALVEFIQEVVRDTAEDVKLDWHGHRDRGLSVPNTLAAVRAGVDRVHGTALGIGERVGNTPMELLLLNMKLMGAIDNDLRRLPDYLEAVGRHCKVPIPPSWPGVGRDCFRISSGDRAEALDRLRERGLEHLMEHLFSSVPCSDLSRSWEYAVGPGSSPANAAGWYRSQGRAVPPDGLAALVERARESGRTLSSEEMLEEVVR